MELIMTRGREFYFTKSLQNFQWCITPFGQAQIDANIYGIISIQYEEVFLSNSFITVKQAKVFPNSDGIIEKDISSIIDAYLSFFVPPVSLDQQVTATGQYGRFKVRCQLYQDSGEIPAVAGTDYITIDRIKGGFPYEYPVPPGYYAPATNRTLRPPYFFTVSPEKVFKEDIFFLFYECSQNVAAESVYAKAILTYLAADGSTGTADKDISTLDVVAAERYVNLLPAGYDQIGLATVLPSGATAISYQIKVIATYDGSTDPYEMIAPQTFYIEQRKFYNTKQLLYRNSLGGLQPLRLRGMIDFNADYEGATVQLVKSPEYLADKNLMAQQSIPVTTEQVKHTGNTGFLNRDQADRLRDLFLSPQVFEVKDNRLVPVVINRKNVKFYGNNDNLVNVVIEWNRAFTDENYSPAISGSNTCPEVSSLEWRQSADDQITVFWTFPFGYNYGRIRIKWVTDNSTQDFYVEGNAGSKKLNFTRPGFATGDEDIIVSGNVVCNRYNATPSLGPNYTLSAANVAVEFSIVALDDYKAIPKGFSTAVTLTNALANDYDPDGGSIEAVAASGSTTGGGSYTINSAGVVTYTPPSSSYTGTDSFTYQAKRTGSSVLATATYRVLVYEA